MNNLKDVATIVDYGTTLAEAVGHRCSSPIEKCSIASSKLLLSAYHSENESELLKEVGHAGITILCSIGGYLTHDKKTAAKMELTGKAILDLAWRRLI